MKRHAFALLFFALLALPALAENKGYLDAIPPLTVAEKADAPLLYDGDVYPAWGVPCTNFTYFVTYEDGDGRAPEYVRINLNGEWHAMQKGGGDYAEGVSYTYNFVPESGEQLFYYYEASNGAGKARTSLIDTADQGPLLFSEKLDNNEIILLDEGGGVLWEHALGREWVEGVALSRDGEYAAAVTTTSVLLFSRDGELLWRFCTECELPAVVQGQMDGVAITADGGFIAATMHGRLYYFNRDSNEPIWSANIQTGAVGIDLSDDGKVIAAGMAQGGGDTGDKLFVFDGDGNALFEYKPEVPGYDVTGDFYQPDVTPDGEFISSSTGCPDRRAYFFTKSGLAFRSAPLAEDSPVHKSSVSDDGSLIAYSADHMQGYPVLFLFDSNGEELWRFSSSTDSTARAVSLSGDGKYVAAGTTAGNVYLFSSGDNEPLWKFSEGGAFSSLADVALNYDGSLLATAGASKKIHLFSRGSNEPLWTHEANTWVTKMDFNGELVLAGTGPREFYGEGQSLPDADVECGGNIIQPPPFAESMDNIMGNDENKTTEPVKDDGAMDGVCGNTYCEQPAESHGNCPQDCCPESGCTGDGFQPGEALATPTLEPAVVNDEPKSFLDEIIIFILGLFGA
ncbi:MAG: WD40 repeat domain-containing protein [Candidatus Micrarchaeia archaeon]